MNNDIVAVEKLALTLVKSNLFAEKSPEQAAVKILAGYELGLQPVQSMQGIDLIQGKVFLKPILLAALAKRSGKYTYKVLTNNDKVCEIEFFEIFVTKTESIGLSIYTIEDAMKMGIANKDNWKKQPANMLFNRALGQGVKHFCPDALGGMPVYTEGEYIENHNCDNAEYRVMPTTISERQQKELVALSRSLGIADDVVIGILKRRKFNHSSEITLDVFDEIKEELRQL